MTNKQPIEPTRFESLYPDDSYFQEVAGMLRFIQRGSSCQLVGLPGVGRSNLLKFLVYNKSGRVKHLGENQKWMHFVLVSFPEIRRRPLFDATKFLFLSLTDSLRERNMADEYQAVTQIFKESLEINYEMML